MRILVVEDNVFVRSDACETLRAAGFAVVGAATADEAWQYLCHGNPIDLVFADIETPGSMDGRALAMSVAASMPGLPVILTSGWQHPHNSNLFLDKPYSFGQVVKLINETLQNA